MGPGKCSQQFCNTPNTPSTIMNHALPGLTHLRDAGQTTLLEKCTQKASTTGPSQPQADNLCFDPKLLVIPPPPPNQEHAKKTSCVHEPTSRCEAQLSERSFDRRHVAPLPGLALRCAQRPPEVCADRRVGDHLQPAPDASAAKEGVLSCELSAFSRFPSIGVCCCVQSVVRWCFFAPYGLFGFQPPPPQCRENKISGTGGTPTPRLHPWHILQHRKPPQRFNMAMGCLGKFWRYVPKTYLSALGHPTPIS